MIVYVFRWRLKPGRETEFRDAWATVTRALLDEGSEGSALFKARDGTWCGIARWPDAATRAKAMSAGDLEAARAIMAAATEELIEVLELDEELNLWAPYPAPESASSASE